MRVCVCVCRCLHKYTQDIALHTRHSISPPATAVFLTVYAHVIIINCKHTLDPNPEAVEHQANSCSICLQPWHLAVNRGGGGVVYIYMYLFFTYIYTHTHTHMFRQ